MNGRTIHKILMKSRTQSLWGRRAYIRVRLPLSAVPVSAPSRDYCADWGVEDGVGYWSKTVDGVQEVRDIAKWSGRKDLVPADARVVTVYPAYSTWLEGTVWRGGEIVGEIDPVAVLAHRDWMAWHDNYLLGMGTVNRGPVLEAFIRAARYAKTHYVVIDGDGSYITYSVKWGKHLNVNTRRFSADLRRALNVAKAHNVPVKVTR